MIETILWSFRSTSLSYLSFPVIKEVITFLLHTRYYRIVTDDHSLHSLERKKIAI